MSRINVFAERQITIPKNLNSGGKLDPGKDGSYYHGGFFHLNIADRSATHSDSNKQKLPAAR